MDDELRYLYIRPGLIDVPAAAFVQVLQAVGARYAAVEHGTTPEHASARAYYSGMLATAQWIALLRATPPLGGADEPPTREALVNLIPRAGLAMNLARGGPHTSAEQRAWGVMGMLDYVLDSENGRDLPKRLGIR